MVLFASDISSEETTSTLTFNLEVVRTLAGVAATHPEVLTDASWDYVLCSMIGWLQVLGNIQDACVCLFFMVVSGYCCIQDR